MPTIATCFAEGLLSARPAASSANTGFMYFASDDHGGTLYQSTGSAWVQVAAAVNSVANAGSAPSLQVGLDSAKPAAGTAGRLYLSTDVPALYEDSGSVWVLMATAAWATITGKPSTFTPSAHESTHLLAGSDALAGVDQTQIDVDATEAATNDSLSGGNLRTNLRRLRYQLAQLGTGAWNTLVAMVQLSPGSQQSGSINVSGEIQGSDFKPGGVTGASAAARYHAATASGHPTTGTWAVGDIVPDQTGGLWMCTTAGTPGTWTAITGGGGGGSSTLAGDTDVAISSPANAQWLQYNSALGKWQNQTPSGLNPNTKVQLDYALASDINGTSLSAGTWTDVISNQSFTVDDTASVVEIAVSGHALVGGTNVGDCSTRVVLDSAGTAVNIPLGGNFVAVAGQYCNPFAGANIIARTGLAVGTHTIKVQAYAQNTDPFYCRPATNVGLEFLNIRVLERKQSSSPPSSTPAPAVRCYNSAAQSINSGTLTSLTFDTNRVDQGTSTSQHSTSSNTSRLTCQQAGLYQIDASIAWDANATGERHCDLRLNGTTYIAADNRLTIGGGAQTQQTVSTLYSLAVGDYVECIVNHTSGGALNVAASGNYSPEFGMARVDTGSTGVLNVYKPTTSASITAVNSLTIVQTSSTTQTLPTAAGVAGESCVVKNASGVTSTTIATSSSQLIDGASTYSLSSSLASVELVSDGTGWYSM